MCFKLCVHKSNKKNKNKLKSKKDSSEFEETLECKILWMKRNWKLYNQPVNNLIKICKNSKSGGEKSSI